MLESIENQTTRIERRWSPVEEEQNEDDEEETQEDEETQNEERSDDRKNDLTTKNAGALIGWLNAGWAIGRSGLHICTKKNAGSDSEECEEEEVLKCWNSSL